jgi:hypothetical protein
MSEKPQDQVFTGGYGRNDPYQFAQDNGLGPLEFHAIKAIVRHDRGEATGQKYGARDVKAAIATLTRLAIDRYGVGYTEIEGVVRTVYQGRVPPGLTVPEGTVGKAVLPGEGGERMGWPRPSIAGGDSRMTMGDAGSPTARVIRAGGMPLSVQAGAGTRPPGAGEPRALDGIDWAALADQLRPVTVQSVLAVPSLAEAAGQAVTIAAENAPFEPVDGCYKPGMCRAEGACLDSAYCLRVRGRSGIGEGCGESARTEQGGKA